MRSTLGGVVGAVSAVGAVEEAGSTKPPGLLVVGEACGVFKLKLMEGAGMGEGRKWVVEKEFVGF